jgi:hypothetical protein
MDFFTKKTANTSAVVPAAMPVSNASQAPVPGGLTSKQWNTSIDREKVEQTAGFSLNRQRPVKPQTEATDGFVEVLRKQIDKMKKTGIFSRYQSYGELANFLSSQLDVQGPLGTLLFKCASGSEGGIPVLWFDMTPDDRMAPLVRILIEEHAHKAIDPTQPIRQFKVDFGRKTNPRRAKEISSSLPATEDASSQSQD